MRYVELRFQARLHGDRSRLPPFLGATLRGALGYLLKQTVCQVSHGRCNDCLLQPACAYPAVFEGLPPANRTWMRKYPKIPQPFVLTVAGPRQNGSALDRLEWGVRLFGPACRYWPYVIHVFHQAGEVGIGKARIPFTVESVSDGVAGWKIFGTDGDPPQPPRESQVLPVTIPRTDPFVLRWVFHTPTRIRDRGGKIDGLTLLLAGRRRMETMWHFYGDQDEQSEVPFFQESDFTTRSDTLRHFGFGRFSGRQRRRMELHGLLGEIEIEGPWGRLAALLSALPIIHLGKSTSFGFGQVTWELT